MRWLHSALDLLDRIDDRCFLTAPLALGGCRVSSQLRHVIEFYECFLDGLAFAHIDYEARKRDMTLETSRQAAAKRIRKLIARLAAEIETSRDSVLFTRVEDAEAMSLEDPFMLSSVKRELMALSSHTVHHFALISMILRAHGVAVDPDFGVAPSTLRHRTGGRVSIAPEAA